MSSIQNISPTPGLNPLQEAGIAAWTLNVEKVTLFENIPAFDSGNVNVLVPPLHNSPNLLPWMNSVVSYAERLMGRISPAHEKWLLQELRTMISWLEEIYYQPSRLGPHTKRKNLANLGRDSLSIQTIEELRYVLGETAKGVLKKNSPTAEWEVGAVLLGTGRFWVGDLHLVGAVDLNLLQGPEHLDRLFEGEIRKRFRVTEDLRRMLVQARHAYPHDHEELLGKLDRRLESILTHANRSYVTFNRSFSQETKEALKESLHPIQNGLNRVLNGLTQAGSELVIAEGGRFTQEHGTQLLNTFARGFNPAASLFLGAIIAGYFAYNNLSEGMDSRKVALQFGLDVAQNVSDSNLIGLASFGVGFV